MNVRNKNIFQTVLFIILLASLSLWCWLKPNTEFSESERRDLERFPEISFSSVLSGDFMTDFEAFTLDQFPLRDKFRTVKALSSTYVFMHPDNNGYYVEDGYIGKMEYPMDNGQVVLATNKFKYIYETYMADKEGKVYLSIIPDKNAHIAEKSGHLSFDYSAMIETVKKNTPFAEYIDITDLLTIDDYYKTDTHWRQDKIVDVAERLAEKMGTELLSEYKENILDKEFFGVYHGQSALPLPSEQIKYLSNSVIDSCIVTNMEISKQIGMYDFEKGSGYDPYELFLSGSVSLITIENPNAKNDKELVVFRDSFGSSLVPLLASGYKSITLVDIRYIPSVILGNFIDFSNKDVLFLYSTLVLNNSSMLK